MIFANEPVKSYQDYCKGWKGNHSASPEDLKKRIINGVDKLINQSDWDSLNLLRALIQCLARPNASGYKLATVIDDILAYPEHTDLIADYSHMLCNDSVEVIREAKPAPFRQEVRG